MSEIQAAFRFGWDPPRRILTATNLLAGADEMTLPGEPLYPTVLPFLAAGASYPTLSGGGLSAGVDVWRAGPDRLDLHWYEGDDITVPLLFKDPQDPSFDMSDVANWEWLAQVRTGHGPSYPLVAEFACTAVYVPPAPPDAPTGQTQVSLFLARADNTTIGNFAWDLQSLSPDPGGKVKTWLWGEVLVAPHVTVIPGEEEEDVIVTPTGTDSFLAIVAGGMKTVGPTGQVG